MALKEQDIVFTGKDASGNTIIQMPITRIENVEGAVKTVNGGVPDANGNVTVTVSGKTVGDQWISVDGTIPEGGLAFNGNEISRDIYADLYNYVVAQGRVIAEKDWQSMYSSNNGNVPYYSSGDGSTTFRLPKFNSYPRFVANGAGTYTKEGLPNITGEHGGHSFKYGDHQATSTGAFAGTGRTAGGSGSDGNHGDSIYIIDFDASRSSSIYGRSSHVTPETTNILVGVIALMSTTSDSNTSLSDVLAAVDALESRTLKIVRYS